MIHCLVGSWLNLCEDCGPRRRIGRNLNPALILCSACLEFLEKIFATLISGFRVVTCFVLAELRCSV